MLSVRSPMNPLRPAPRRLRRRRVDLRGDFGAEKPTQIHCSDLMRCRRPVLLLHGFLQTHRAFRVLEARLRRDGYGVLSIELGGLFDSLNTHGIDESAEKVRKAVEHLYARFPHLGPLSVIGHSKGGLIGRYYVKRLGGHERVRTLITLGTPHRGTPVAYAGVLALGLISRSIWQMTPLSPFIHRLSSGVFPLSVRFVSVYSKVDRASPFPSCILEGNQPNLFNVEVDGIAHSDFLLRRSVYAIVRRELAFGGEEDDLPGRAKHDGDARPGDVVSWGG